MLLIKLLQEAQPSAITLLIVRSAGPSAISKIIARGEAECNNFINRSFRNPIPIL